MDQELVELIFGSALHDVGKLIQRHTRERVKHSQLGGDFLRQFQQLIPIASYSYYHHYHEINQAKLKKNSLEYIAYIADNISSGIDRKTAEVGDAPSEYRNWDIYLPQEDIFHRIYDQKTVRYYEPRMLNDQMQFNFAAEKVRDFNPGDYGQIIEQMKNSLRTLELHEQSIASLNSLLESTLSYVPSSTNKDEARDISLYDHSKLTAGLAACIYLYLQNQGDDDYYQRLYRNSKDFYQEQAFRLLSVDLSGVQSFIYTIVDKDAAKMLRSRSFYLEILMENFVDELLTAMNLSRMNVIYTGGGHAYLLMPNTSKALDAAKRTQQLFNRFLQETFGHALYIAMGSASFSGDQAKGETDDFGTVYQEAGREVSEQKLQRYSAGEIMALNERGKKRGRECRICSRIYGTEEVECEICRGLINFSNDLLDKDLFQISHNSTLLPVGPNQYLRAIYEKDLDDLALQSRLYSKNKYYTGLPHVVNLWVGDYSDKQTFSNYVEQAEGIERLGIVRCDVDSLGAAFVGGFHDYYNTLSRSATFSRQLDMFFKFHVNHILASLEAKGAVIYTGGDDVFIVGSWWDMLRFAIQLRQDFIQLSQGKLTLSTGFGIYPDKTPIALMARQVGQLEEVAKDYSETKDSITLFDPAFTFKWDVFIESVWTSKFLALEEFFNHTCHNQEYGNSFVYNLLKLLNEADDELTHARWSYYLVRMEPNESDLKTLFQELSRKLYTWFNDPDEILALKVALILYVYKNRREE